MILIGQYDSPFVRRVAIALRLYDIAYTHQPWSTFSDAEAIAAYNPLRRVPTLVLDDGEVLIESAAMLDHLDEIAPPGARLMPDQGPARRAALRICALASGLSDKAVSLLYERVLRSIESDVWVARCRSQIAAVLDWLEHDRAAHPTLWWHGDRLAHADIALGCALRFVREAHPAAFDGARWPALTAHGDRCEALAVFQAVVQPLRPPETR